MDAIRADLWDQAQWAAMAFVIAKDGKEPPMLGFAFEAPEKGIAAFRHLSSATTSDPTRVRVSVITNAVKGRYVVQVSGEPSIGPSEGAARKRMFVTVTRIKDFQSASGLPLIQMFKAAQAASGTAVICPASLEEGGFRPIRDGAIKGVRVLIREFSEVPENDLDMLAVKRLLDGDDSD